MKSAGYSHDETTGLFCGGHTQQSTNRYQNRIQKITMATTGNATDHANLTGVNAYMIKGVISDNTTGLVGGGYNGSADVQSIDRFTIATGANATDHGDLPNGVNDGGACSNGTHGEFFASNIGAGVASGPNLDGRRYVVTIATAGNASFMGYLAIRWYSTSGFSGA